MTTDKKRIRRNHSPELKARILAECDLPGASVATVAMAHGMNANVELKFAAKSESYSPERRSLLEETIDADIAAIEEEADAVRGKPSEADKRQAKRQPLPAHLPRREVRHEPENTTCRCGCAMKRIGEDVAEKLDYVPGVFTVERHVRGKWVCKECETLVQAPVASHIIDKGIPTTGLLAQVLVAKYADHLPRTGHADDPWRGTLVCDDYAGYKAMFEQGVTEAGCLAHARRKFHELWDPHRSPVAEQALKFFAALYDVERDAQALDPGERRALRQARARLIADDFYPWLQARRVRIPDGSAIAKAIDYSLGRWTALTRYLDDGDVPCDNNWVENQIRPIAIGRSNWLFAGSLRAGKRAAAITSLIHSAKLNGHDPYAYLRDVMKRLPTQQASLIEELLPHRWQAPSV